MKKSLILASVAALMLSSTMCYANNTPTLKANNNTTKIPQCNCQKKQLPPQKAQRPSLDEKLKLTDEQKKQAHDIRMKGHEKMKPVMQKMKAKHKELNEVINSNLNETKKEQKINAIERELLDLKQQARKIRTENMKEFESILTAEQKTAFEKIKQEGREKHKMRKHHCPKKGFGPAPFGPMPPFQK